MVTMGNPDLEFLPVPRNVLRVLDTFEELQYIGFERIFLLQYLLDDTEPLILFLPGRLAGGICTTVPLILR